jgi:hypothetical protein
MFEEFKKGGKVKRKQQRVKKVIKKVVRKRVVKPKKDKITTQRGFEMFGYSTPATYNPPAPQRPVGEEEYKKINELLQKTQEERKEAEIKKKVEDEIKGKQIPSGQPAIMPDYERLNKRLEAIEEAGRSLMDMKDDSGREQKMNFQMTQQGQPRATQQYSSGITISSSKAGAPKKTEEQKQRTKDARKKRDKEKKMEKKADKFRSRKLAESVMKNKIRNLK